jgi:hypothetical protein
VKSLKGIKSNVEPLPNTCKGEAEGFGLRIGEAGRYRLTDAEAALLVRSGALRSASRWEKWPPQEGVHDLNTGPWQDEEGTSEG